MEPDDSRRRTTQQRNLLSAMIQSCFSFGFLFLCQATRKWNPQHHKRTYVYQLPHRVTPRMTRSPRALNTRNSHKLVRLVHLENPPVERFKSQREREPKNKTTSLNAHYAPSYSTVQETSQQLHAAIQIAIIYYYLASQDTRTLAVLSRRGTRLDSRFELKTLVSG